MTSAIPREAPGHRNHPLGDSAATNKRKTAPVQHAKRPRLDQEPVTGVPSAAGVVPSASTPTATPAQQMRPDAFTSTRIDIALVTDENHRQLPRARARQRGLNQLAILGTSNLIKLLHMLKPRTPQPGTHNPPRKSAPS